MTIMVLGLPLPEAQHNINSSKDVLSHLLDYSELFWTYALSFLLLGYFWINQQKLFKYVNKTCPNHLWTNLGELLLVCVIPFSSGLVGGHIQYFISNFIFHVNILLIGVFFLIQCTQLLRYPQIVSDEVTREDILLIVRINLVLPSLAVAGMIISIFAPPMSLLVYLFTPIMTSLVSKRLRTEVHPIEDIVSNS